MQRFSSELSKLFAEFAPLFTRPTAWHALRLLEGAILTVGRRTVASALRSIGRQDTPHFQNYHRVLSRARWSCREAGKILLLRLVDTFVPQGPLVFGLDDTIERRWGPKIKARGIYRDPVRSSRGHFVKASGLRWVSLRGCHKINIPFTSGLHVYCHAWKKRARFAVGMRSLSRS